MKYVYWILSAGSLGLLAVDAPSGSLLTGAPERGKVQTSNDPKGPKGPQGRTVRGHGMMFIWLGGGYHGGK